VKSRRQRKKNSGEVPRDPFSLGRLKGESGKIGKAKSLRRIGKPISKGSLVEEGRGQKRIGNRKSSTK